MPFFEMNKTKINYEIKGSGSTPILFLHGNLASNRWWYPSDPYWNNNSHRIYAELRGCGLSSAPQSAAEIGIEIFAKDFLALMDHLKLEKANIVGHSTGGLVAAYMMAFAPARFSRAVLLDPVGVRGIRLKPEVIPAYEAMKTSPQLTALVISNTILNCDTKSEAFRQIAADGFSAIQKVGSWIVEAMVDLDSSAIVKKIETPTKIFHGEQDILLPLSDSKEMAELIASAIFEIIPNHGHCTNIEDPKLFVHLVEHFLYL